MASKILMQLRLPFDLAQRDLICRERAERQRKARRRKAIERTIPSLQDLVGMLGAAYEDCPPISKEAWKEIDESGEMCLDVRLWIHGPGDWEFNTGCPDYDRDLRGACGAASIHETMSGRELHDVAQGMLAEIRGQLWDVFDDEHLDEDEE